jgi:two-component sensor histidine kinase/HPt (histidine-containing phosphotransfer) domain-containing protein
MFSGFNFKKYRAIIVAIIAFLLLVIGILGLNFYISFEAHAHAQEINIAGRQRMLSQRIAKSLFDAETQFLDGEIGKYQKLLGELKQSVDTFDNVLHTFISGGDVAVGEMSGQHLTQIDTDDGQKILAEALVIWTPFKKEFSSLQEQVDYFEAASFDNSTIALLDTAVQYAEENDSQLLVLMNQLMAEAERVEIDSYAMSVVERQRILSQQIVKSLLRTKNAFRSGNNFKPALKELITATEMFDNVLLGLKTGAIDEGDDEEPVSVTLFTEHVSETIVSDALAIWKPLLGHIIRVENVMQSNGVIESDVRHSFVSATLYAEANINVLLKLMNSLTIDIQQSSEATADFSRRLQVVGILLALFIFAFIAYEFFGQLRVSDLYAEKSQQETQQILDTVDQGLFLMGKDLVMASQYSKQMETIFSDSDIAGRGFPSYIENLVSEKDAKRVKRFFNLLFDPHKKQQLLGDLNPLKQVSVQIKDNNERFVNKYLSFSFSRINDGEGISKILTSVNDISEEVRLSAELERATKKNEQQVELLTSLMNSDVDMLPVFIKNAYEKYEKINALLKSSANSVFDYKAKVNRLLVLIHGVKGESSALSLSVVADMCHDFEQQLIDLRERSRLSGNDFLGLTVKLDQLLTYNNLMSDLYRKVFSPRLSEEGATPKMINWSHLHTLSDDVALRQKKEVSLVISGLDSPNIDEELAVYLNTISIQLIRNSIVHGIESSSQRLASKKYPKGKISITLAQEAGGGYLFLYKDDGQGIDIHQVIERAVSAGIITREETVGMSKKTAAKLILSPEITTTKNVALDAGRGVGMAAVNDAVEALGGKISISTNAGRGTVFKIRFTHKKLNKSAKKNTKKVA